MTKEHLRKLELVNRCAADVLSAYRMDVPGRLGVAMKKLEQACGAVAAGRNPLPPNRNHGATSAGSTGPRTDGL